MNSANTKTCDKQDVSGNHKSVIYRMEELEKMVSESESKITALEKEKELLQNRISDLEIENTVWEQKFKQLEHKVNITATYIGFGAYRTDTTDVAFHETVVYDTVTANLGNGYDHTTGIFNCPVSGYYYFGVMAFSTIDFNLAQLMVGDTPQLTAFGDNTYWDQGMMAMLVECGQGTEVYVRNGRDQSVNFAQKPDDPPSQDDTFCNGFMGFLVSMISS